MSKIQAVLFQKSKWKTQKCRNWLQKNNFKPIKRVHITNKYYRYRIRRPKQFKRLRTKIIDKSNGIHLIIGFK